MLGYRYRVFRGRLKLRLALAAVTLSLAPIGAAAHATADPCLTSKTKLACLNSLPTATQISDHIHSAHAIVALPSTRPTLAYLSNTVTGVNSFYMPTGRCNQVAHQTDGSPPSISDCTFGNSKASSANTIVLTGDSRAVMWTTAYAKLATSADKGAVRDLTLLD